MINVHAVEVQSPLRALVPITQSGQDRLAHDVALGLTASSVMTLFVLPSSHLPLSDLVEEASTMTAGFHVPRDASGKPEGGIILRFGELEAEIVGCANDFDLIVMKISDDVVTEDGRTRNIAGWVARTSQTPILLFRPSHYLNGVKTPSRIVVPLDGSEMAEQALEIATTLSQRLRAPILLVHVLDLGLIAKSTAAQQNAEQAIQKYLRAQVTGLQRKGVEAEFDLLYGSPGYSICDQLSTNDLVILASHGTSKSNRWLMGSISTLLIQQAVCPILLVPSDLTIAAPHATAPVDESEPRRLSVSPYFDS